MLFEINIRAIEEVHSYSQFTHILINVQMLGFELNLEWATCLPHISTHKSRMVYRFLKSKGAQYRINLESFKICTGLSN